MNIKAAFWVRRRGQCPDVRLLAVTWAPRCVTQGTGTDLHHTRLAAKGKCAHRTCTCSKDKLQSVAEVGIRSLVSWCTGSKCASSSVLLESEALKRPQNLNPINNRDGFLLSSRNIVVMLFSGLQKTMRK